MLGKISGTVLPGYNSRQRISLYSVFYIN